MLTTLLNLVLTSLQVTGLILLLILGSSSIQDLHSLIFHPFAIFAKQSDKVLAFFLHIVRLALIVFGMIVILHLVISGNTHAH